MRQFGSADNGALRYTHHKYKGMYHIWIDKPEKGWCMTLKIQDFDSVLISVMSPDDEPFRLLDQMLSAGWRKL